MRHPLLNFRLVLLILGVILLVAACKDLLTPHNIDLEGTMHGKKLYSGVKNCTSCHGIALGGNATIPSCYSCHDAIWNKSDHIIKYKGVPHLLGVNAASVCSDCHGGRGLRGKNSRPSCYQCHDDLWSQLAFHNQIEHGFAHGPGLETPLTSGCATDLCHGTTLQGAVAQSCYRCHGNKWDGNND